MSPAEFVRHRDRLGGEAALAELFRVDPRNPRRWAAGENPVPWSVAAVLLLAERYGLDAEDLAQLDQV